MARSNPIVSILVPIYNVEGYVEECVRTLLSQSYEECRYIFVDDASTDRSAEVLRATVADYPHRASQIKIISHPQNRGIGATRNTLLDNAEGDYILWVDSDDWCSVQMTESLVTRAIITRADALRCGRVIVDAAGGCRADLFTWLDGERGVERTRRVMLSQSHLVTCNIHGVMVRRELIERCGIRIVEGVNFAEDYLFMAQVLMHATAISTLPAPLYFYRSQREGSYMDSLSSERNVESYLRANEWVTTYVEREVGTERYHSDLASAKLNIKKWIAYRGLRTSQYEEQLFRPSREYWLRSFGLKVYDKMIDLNILLLTRLCAFVVSFGVVVEVAKAKFKIKRALGRERIWGQSR